MGNPYFLLGLTEDALPDELKARYIMLKQAYSEEMLLSGDAGKDAAENLSLLEDAWRMIEDINRKNSLQRDGIELKSIEQIINTGELATAQEKLDSITSRTAEWHYLQSVIFYKKDWLSESKVQLQTAVSMEPDNQKYRMALDNLINVIGNPNVDAKKIGKKKGQKRTQHSETCDNLENCCLCGVCSLELCGEIGDCCN